MLLADADLAYAVATGHLGITPFTGGNIQPASIDLSLSARFRVFTGHQYESIDPDADMPGLTIPVQPPAGQPFILHPGEFALGSTTETVTLPQTWRPGSRANRRSAGSA